ncbi:MAG: hypothetical protein ACKO1U_08115, partial [Bacteroidota bacterium]
FHLESERNAPRTSSVKTEEEVEKKDTPVDSSEKEPVVSESTAVVLTEQVFLSVQLIISSTKLEKDNPRFKGLKGVWEEKAEKFYKYHVGHFRSMEDAVAMQTDARAKGFKDAFVVAFKGDKRIPVAEAREQLKKDTAK